ncbi:MAG TPA: DDE-type integrase/transposase/recombinase [Acidimicrobiales bacterium]|nr:DDE-type integrase/transposase/recombinase [Acidimicrobiales bacterium]
MAANAIASITERRFVKTTLPAKLAPELPDLVQGDFSPGEPNRRYAGDITYIPTGESWLYLASVLDLGCRRFGGFEMADHMRDELTCAALESALALRGSLAGALFHSDRGALLGSSAGSTGTSASASVSGSPPGESPRASTTPPPNRSGRR